MFLKICARMTYFESVQNVLNKIKKFWAWLSKVKIQW